MDNRVSIVVTVDRQKIETLPDRDRVLRALAGELTMDGRPTKVRDIEAALRDPRFSPLEPVPVAVDVSEDLEVRLVERADELPGVQVRRETVRTYPHGRLAAHVLGYVGRITESEFAARMGKDGRKRHPKPYERDDRIGKAGVELAYEDVLRGTPGLRVLEVDARGFPLRTLRYEEPRTGDDLVLNIDGDLQQVVEQALAAGLEEARRPGRSSGAKPATAGAAVVMDPRSGAVLALASLPNYDPEEFVMGIPLQRYEELRRSGDPFTDRAVAGQYPPGSTFKIFTAAAALEDGLITEYSTYYDRGSYTLASCAGRCSFRNARGASYGSVDVRRALTVSSDVFFYWLGDRFWRSRDRLGESPVQEVAARFGLGGLTGIDLPGERPGVLPTPQLRRQLHEENPEAFPYPDWYAGDNVNTAIGQGDVLVTPVQLAVSYAALATGEVVQPRVAEVVASPPDSRNPGEVVRRIEPRVLRRLDLDARHRSVIIDGLVGVTSRSGGTARSAFEGWDHDRFPVAGKTGTAEVRGKEDTAWFVAFAPAHDPRWVVAVVMEEAGFGGEAAAPVARKIFDHLVMAG